MISFFQTGPTSATFGFDGSKFLSTIHHSPFLLRKLKFSISNTLHNRRKLRRLVHFVVPVQNHLEKSKRGSRAFRILENPLRFFKWAMPFLKEPTPILVWLKVSLSVSDSAAFYKIYVGVPWVGSMDTPDPVRKYESCVLSPTLLFRR